MTTRRAETRVLVAVPAFNEQATIAGVVEGIRRAAPDFDVLVVNDGSRDHTGEIVRSLDVIAATHACNLGYGRTLQTAMKYALVHGYDAVITMDADGQHRADDVRRLQERFTEGQYDLLIGSRFVEHRRYGAEPPVRRVGMYFFSLLVWILTGRRIFDTSSGLKVIGRRVFAVLTSRPVVDFHAEVIVYLLLRGYHVGEAPITVERRQHGRSMYTALSAIKYPMKLFVLILLSAVEARLKRGR